MRKIEIKTLAEKAFKDHIITELIPIEPNKSAGMWRCYKPGTGIYSFAVAIMPGGFIAVAGDVGDIIMRCNESYVLDVIAWIRGNVDSPDYFVSKVQPVCRDSMTQFSSEKAREYLAEMEDQDQAARIESEWEDSEFGTESEEGWCIAHVNILEDYEYPKCHEFTPSALWAIECLRLFAKLIAEEPKEQ